MTRKIVRDEQGEILMDLDTGRALRAIAAGYSLMRRGTMDWNGDEDPFQHIPAELEIEMRMRWMCERFLNGEAVSVEDSDEYIRTTMLEAMEMSEFFDKMKRQGVQ